MNETALALAAYLRKHETRPEAPQSTEERAEREETARERWLREWRADAYLAAVLGGSRA